VADNESRSVWRDGSLGRRAGYNAAIIINVVILYAAHHLLEWGVPFLTPSFNDVLWALTLSIGATIIANALFIVYDRTWFRHLAQLVLDGLALVSVYTLYRVFPFDFSSAGLTTAVNLALLFTLFGVTVALLVQIVRMLTDGNWWQEAGSAA
jgi:hypothetical protein